MKKIFISSLIFSFLLVNAPVVSAQVPTTFQPQTQAELIAYLQGIIAQLQAQLQARQQFVQTNQFGRVLGVSTGQNNSSLQVRVGTGFVSIDNDEATLNGTVDLLGVSSARVWFEYGEDDDMDDNTPVRTVTRDQRISAQVDLDDIDEYLYYRAVAEGPNGRRDYGVTRAVFVDGGFSSRNDDEPDVRTRDADDVDEDSAELNGEVDMNDFRNGLVFFVYGEDEDLIDDVDREDEFRDVDEEGDDLQKIIVDRDLDDDARYTADVFGLDDDTEHYFRICVEYEDEDDDETLECGAVEEFETDRD